MPKSHKPSEVSQALTRRNGGKYSVPSNGHQCAKSPSGSHWWNIGSLAGEVSAGVCRYCGVSREFANSLADVFILRRK